MLLFQTLTNARGLWIFKNFLIIFEKITMKEVLFVNYEFWNDECSTIFWQYFWQRNFTETFCQILHLLKTISSSLFVIVCFIITRSSCGRALRIGFCFHELLLGHDTLGNIWNMFHLSTTWQGSMAFMYSITFPQHSTVISLALFM